MAARKKLVQLVQLHSLPASLHQDLNGILPDFLANMLERAESYQRCPEVMGILVEMSTPQHGVLIKPFVISQLFFLHVESKLFSRQGLTECRG